MIAISRTAACDDQFFSLVGKKSANDMFCAFDIYRVLKGAIHAFGRSHDRSEVNERIDLVSRKYPLDRRISDILLKVGDTVDAFGRIRNSDIHRNDRVESTRLFCQRTQEQTTDVSARTCNQQRAPLLGALRIARLL